MYMHARYFFFGGVLFSMLFGLKMNPNILQNKFAHIHFCAYIYTHKLCVCVLYVLMHSQEATPSFKSRYVICKRKPRRRKREHMCNIFRLFASSRSCINVRIATINNIYLLCATNTISNTGMVFALATSAAIHCVCVCACC